MLRFRILLIFGFLLLAFSVQVIGQSTLYNYAPSPLRQYVDPNNPFPSDSLPTNNGRKAAPSNEQTDNFTQFTSLRSYNIDIAKTRVPMSFWSNPDFGTLPAGTACMDCYEEIHKRTVDYRYFRSQQDTGKFYIQKFSGPANFFQNGQWLSIDPRLSQISADEFTALQQPIAARLRISSQRSTLGEGNFKFGFNHFSMIEYDLQGQPHTFNANWQNYTVGSNGIHIHNVFPGIDLILKYLEGSVKSSFIIQHARTNSSKIVFIDELELVNGMTIANYDGQGEPEGWWGDLSINDVNGQSQYIYGNIKIFSDAMPDSIWHGNYTFLGNKINLNIAGRIYNDPSMVFPLTIDPLVTYGPFNGTANVIGLALSPAFCSDFQVVAVPGQATYTDFAAAWSITNAACGGCVGANRCFVCRDQVYISASCGGTTPNGAPGIVWTCDGATCAVCNSFGTWIPTIAFGTGESAPATCITPSCNVQNITYTIFVNKFVCNTATCNSCVYATNSCGKLNSWSVSLEGHTVEQTPAPSSSNGTVFCLGNCTNLTATGTYGVPPYTYLWNPGGATTNPYMNVCPAATTTYTCTITDACGVTATNQVTITISGCMPVELLSFTAKEELLCVKLDWSTASETNTDHFILERSSDAINFIPITTVDAGGNSTERIDYHFYDENPPLGTVYYRLKLVDQDLTSSYSTIVAVNIKDESKLFIRPNPVKNSAEIGFACDEGGTATIKIFSELGQEVYSKKLSCISGRNIEVLHLGTLTKGIYFVRVKVGDQELKKRFVKE